MRKLLDDPPADLWNTERLMAKGIDDKYLEAEKGIKTLGLEVVIAVSRLFSGPFGFAYAAKLN